MSEINDQKIKYKRAGSLHSIRIRPGMRSANMSPLKMQTQLNKDIANNKNQTNINQNQGQNIQSILRKIPRTIQMQDNVLVQGHFSYVDEGFYKWKKGKIIGKGNSCVRKAMNVKTGVIAAAKQIIFANQEQEKQRVHQINILKKLNHPNIVSYFEHHKIQNSTWIFMQYVPTNLRNFYLDFGAPPPEIFLKFAKQIVSALAYLQKNNIIHKDIKCENILLDNEGILKLCDFGCSKDFRSTMSLKLYQKNDAVKSFKGSYLWTAPQCLIGKTCLASDIWSLGCSLVQLASGRLPWDQKKFDNQLQAIKFIVQENQMPKILPEWDSRVKEIIQSCLKRNPDERITAIQLLSRKQLWE